MAKLLVREKLAYMLTKKLREQFGKGYYVCAEDLKSSNSCGAKTRSWDGYASRGCAEKMRVYSYHTMGELVKRDFTVTSGGVCVALDNDDYERVNDGKETTIRKGVASNSI